MASFARIEIYKKHYSIVAGRRKDGEPELHHRAWAKISSLYGTELYGAMDVRLENTAVFEVRYCKAIKELRQHLKDFYIVYEGEIYDVYATDFYRNEMQFIQLKANRRD